MHKRLSGSNLKEALPKRDVDTGGSDSEVARMDALAARAAAFFRAKEAKEQRERNRGR